MHQEKRMRTLFLMSKGSASDIASLYPPVKTGGFIAPSNYPFSLKVTWICFKPGSTATDPACGTVCTTTGCTVSIEIAAVFCAWT